jgi:hypothetical protein
VSDGQFTFNALLLGGTVIEDEVVREVRAVREAFAAAHNYDIFAMCATLKASQDASGRTVIPAPPPPNAPKPEAGMILITFPTLEAKRAALCELAGRFDFKSWATGEMLVPEDALPFLTVQGVSFTVESRTGLPPCARPY